MRTLKKNGGGWKIWGIYKRTSWRKGEVHLGETSKLKNGNVV